MDKKNMLENAGIIEEQELVELLDTSEVNGGTTTLACAISATVGSATAISALFTVTSACTKKC